MWDVSSPPTRRTSGAEPVIETFCAPAHRIRREVRKEDFEPVAPHTATRHRPEVVTALRYGPRRPRDKVVMPTPGFPPNTLDGEGFPLWISGLEDEGPNHCVHVVDGLDPADALETLGAKPHLFQPCELPDRKPENMSLPRAALGESQGDSSASLLAGRIGEWTFVYDDFGATDDLEALSADERIAVTSYFSINADASLIYYADGDGPPSAIYAESLCR